MDSLFKKLNYKDHNRIAIVNCPEYFYKYSSKVLPGVQIDTTIDPRYPYAFMMVFSEQVTDVESLAPLALHNLVCDGTLWFVYPRENSKKSESDLDQEHGWEVLTERGVDKVRRVLIDEDWSAIKFRNVRFIKSSNARFTH